MEWKPTCLAWAPDRSVKGEDDGWMYAFFPKATPFRGITKDNKQVDMLITMGTLCKIKVVDGAEFEEIVSFKKEI